MIVLNVSNFNVFDLGYSKGRVSTYLPLMGFVKRGDDVYWLTSATEVEAGDDQKLTADGIKVVRFSYSDHTLPRPTSRSFLLQKLTSVSFILSAFRAGCRIGKPNRPDIIVAHQLASAFPAFLLSRRFKVPYVVKAYGFYSDIFERRLYWGKLAFKLPASLYIITDDGTAGDQIARSYGVPPERIAFLRNGIDKELPTTANRLFRNELAPNGEKVVLLISSHLSHYENADVLVRTVPEVLKRNLHVVFVIVGEGEEKPKLLNICNELGVEDSVKFGAKIPHAKVVDYLCAADVVVSINAVSNLSNTAFEAMCCGKPIIATETGRTSEIIKDGENGILLEQLTVERLAQHISQLLENDELCHFLGKGARNTIENIFFSWEERVNKEVGLIDNLVYPSKEGD